MNPKSVKLFQGDTNMIVILYDNGDIEYNSIVGNDYFLKDEIPEQKMKIVLECFLRGDYELKNVYYFEKLVESNLFISGKKVKVKELSFLNRIRRCFYRNDFVLKDGVVYKF